MFVSLMAYPEFYKAHMQLFIAIAPVMYLEYLGAEIFKVLNKDKNAIKLLQENGWD